MCNEVQVCRVCGKELTKLEILCGMDICFDCVENGYDEDFDESNGYYELDDESDDDYKELDFS